MRSSKMGIKGKLLFIVSVAVFAFGALAIYSSRTITEMKLQIELLGLHRIPISDTLGDIRSSSNSVPRFMWLSLAQAAGSAERKQSLKRVSNDWESWEKNLDKIVTFKMSDQAKQKIAEIKELMPKFAEIIEQGKNGLLVGSLEQDAFVKELLMKQMPPVAVKLTNRVQELAEIVDSKNKIIIAESQSLVARAQTILLVFTLSLGLIFVTFALIFTSRLARQLLGITESVAEASTQVTVASSQLSKSAEQLSAASQEQAAATEQTSAALTQIAGMVEANVQGAEKANEYAREVHSISEDTKKSMEELRSAMASILESNERIEQLVKVIEEIGEKTEVIDDIVFKTQLLSFNASVEAERAGEHGRGFAVVAQEVGNLAQMSGKAATEIAGIVKQSIKEAGNIAVENKSRVEKGENLATETGGKMSKVLSCLSNILETTNKIVAASKEQSQGIGQITTSVDGLNQSTQEIANTSEESASASEELSGQAESLLTLVESLRELVTGSAERKHKKASSGVGSKGFKTADSSNKVVDISNRTRSSVSKSNTRNASGVPSTPLKKSVGSELIDSSDEWEKL